MMRWEGLRTALLREHLPLVAWTAMALLYRGHGFAVGDQNLYLPFVLHWNDPTLFPHDYLFWLRFPRESFVWAAVAWFARFLDLEALMLWSNIAVSYLTLWAVFKLGLAWFEDRRAAWVAVLFWTPVYELPGSGQDTVDPYLTTRNIAYMLAMFGLAALIRSRTTKAVLSFCAATLVHLLSVAQVAGAATLLYLTEKEYKKLAALVLGLVPCILLLLWWAGKAPGMHDMQGFYDPDWYGVASRGAACLFPECWTPRPWQHIFGYLLAYTGMAVYLRSRDRWGRAERVGLLLVLSTVLLGLVSVWGAFFRVVLPVQLSLMRGCLFLILVATFSLVPLVTGLLTERNWPYVLLGALSAGAWMSDNALFQMGGVALAIAATESRQPRFQVQKFWGRVLALGRPGLLAGVMTALALYALDFYFGVFPSLAKPNAQVQLRTLVFASVVTVGLVTVARWFSGRVIPVALFIAFAALCIVQPGRYAVETFGRASGVRWFYQYSRSKALLWYRYTPLPPARKLLATAVSAHVPRDATVIVPAGWDSFRLMTHRSSFVTMEDMIPAEFNRAYAMEWRSRFGSLYGPEAYLNHDALMGEPSLGETALLQLREQYRDIHLDYIVTRRNYDFVLIAQAGGWSLYELQKRAPAGAALEQKSAGRSQRGSPNE